MDKLLTTREAAEFLHMSLRKFKYLTRAKKIAPVQIGLRGAKFYSPVQLTEFILTLCTGDVGRDPCKDVPAVTVTHGDRDDYFYTLAQMSPLREIIHKTVTHGDIGRDPCKEKGDNLNMITTKGIAPKKNNASKTYGTCDAGINDDIRHPDSNTTSEPAQPVPAAQIIEPVDAQAPAAQIANLPPEFLRLQRFFPVKIEKGKKVPMIKGWQKAENLMTAAQAATKSPLIGFLTSGHGVADNYLLLDFDHVLDGNGHFVNDAAALAFNEIQQRLGGYAEISVSSTGIHIFAKLTNGKFPQISNSQKGVLCFDRKGGAKLELFYASAGRYCLTTGKLFRTMSRDIAQGEVADAVVADILNAIQGQLALSQPTLPETLTSEPLATDTHSLPAKRPARQHGDHDADPDYDLFRARIMLDTINPTALDYSDWLAVVSSCKNFGVDYADVDAFNQRDSKRYDPKANQKTWDSLNDPSFGIETLHGVAKRFGYSERDTQRKWYELYTELRPSSGRDIDEATATEIDDAVIWLESLEPVDLTADVARDKATLRRIALAEVYCPNTADKFFDVLKQAKAAARDRLKLDDADRKSKQEGGVPREFFQMPVYSSTTKNDYDKINLIHNPTETLDDKTFAELSALVNVNINDIRARVKRLVTEIIADRKKIIRKREEAKKREAIAARISARQQHVKEDLERLQELRPQYCEAFDAGDKELCQKIAAEMYRLIRAACDVKTDRYTGEITRYENSAHNLNLIFNYDPALYKLFARNEFTDAIDLIKNAPWGTRKGDQWTDADDAQLRNDLAQKYKNLRGRDVILDSVVHFANENKFHPVRDYFKNLPAWDGKPRVETLFIDWLNVDDNPFTREATLKGLLAAVCRVFHPGCPFQFAIVLQGAQGIGKSFILERLGGQWYNAITDRVDDPHAVDALRLTWLAEFKEMTAMRKSDINAIKQFIELPTDTRRFAYERRARTVPRQCVFFITVNDDEFLNDPTGARRFWILQSHSQKFGYVKSVRGEVFDDKLVSQIWAEVYARYKELFGNGFDAAKLRLSPESERYGEEVAELFTRNDLEGEIAAFLDTKILPTVIWDLMTREERRKFFAQKNFVITRDNLTARFRSRRVTAERQAKFDAATKLGDFVLLKTGYDHDTHEYIDYLDFYGTEYRQHICATEIFNEAFGTDKRKSMLTINAILQHLDGWTLGKRIQKDVTYGDMRKVYYRNADNVPEPIEETTDTAAQSPQTTSKTASDCFNGEPVNFNNTPCPFDPDELPI